MGNPDARPMVDLGLAASFIGGAIVSIIIISNPLSTSAVFIALTEPMTHTEKLVVARRSVTYSTGVLLFFAITGLALFKLFGFSIGGINARDDDVTSEGTSAPK